MSSARPRRRRIAEIQIHSSDIRSGVRYLKLGEGRLRLAGVVLAAWAGLVAAGTGLLPATAAGLLRAHEARQGILERSSHSDRLRLLTRDLAAVTRRGEELRLRLARVHLAYGLRADGAAGQGGYPHPGVTTPAALADSPFAEAVEYGARLVAEAGEEADVVAAFLEEVKAFETAHREEARLTPSISPLAGEFVLTSAFGTRRSPFTREPHFHAGLDLAAPQGAAIRAPADGVVVFAGRYPLKASVGWWRYGNLVAVAHADRFVTLYGHCAQLEVRSGERVRQGERLATVGNTGWSTSPHLHYEVRARQPGGVYEPTDPRIYILDRGWGEAERRLAAAPKSTGAVDPLPALLRR